MEPKEKTKTTGLSNKNSASGTNSTKKQLAIEDILSIIKVCSENMVQEFTFQDLSLKFRSQRNENAVNLGQDADHALPTPMVSEKFTHEVELMDQNAVYEAEEAQLLIDDAMSFERSQIDRHVERNRNES
jgi:hypothetical protein